MGLDLGIPLDRVTYRDGQLLTARDLRDEHRRDARLRTWHNRYVHGAWGVALGCAVRRAKNRRAAIVGPGCAVDGDGRDLLLARAVRVPAPDVAGPELLVLALSYQPYGAPRDRAELTAVCPGSELDLQHGRADVCWVRPGDLQLGAHVPLAAARVANGVIEGRLDPRVRRNARRLVRPHVGWGATEAGRTRWHDASEPHESLEVTVDTSEAGFVRAPQYFATLCRRRDADRTPPPDSFAAMAAKFGDEAAFFQSDIGFIAEATSARFSYRIIRGTFPFGVQLTARDAETDGWTVSWLGLEAVTGCEPSLDLRWLVALAGHLRHAFPA